MVVGPQYSSGKSNLIDALRWSVQRDTARELRVTQNRKSYLTAQKQLNHWEWLKLKCEVGRPVRVNLVARRIFTSGESEYFFCDEKIRWREWKENLEKGTGIERLSAGIVGAKSTSPAL